MYSCTGPQLLLTCEWRDAHLETSVGHDTHRTSGTSNDASYILLIPLTGSKNQFSAPNGSPKRSGLTATWPISYLIWAGSCLYTSGLSIEHLRWAKKSRWPAYPPSYLVSLKKTLKLHYFCFTFACLPFEAALCIALLVEQVDERKGTGDW
jgi:hypothetical protein